MGSTTLALLTVLAVSQVRSRAQVSEVSAGWKRGRTDLFGEGFPAEYYDVRGEAARDYFFAGLSMARTLPTALPDLKRIMRNGGSVRLLLPNPNNVALLTMVAETKSGGRSASVRRKIEHAIATANAELASLARSGTFEVRVTDVLPRIGINAFDVDEPGGRIMIQMYQFQPTEESAPIFILGHDDAPWYEHFRREASALWESGTVWKTSASARKRSR
ncbi:hypothetical protein FHE66_14670 [Georgenia sp. 311]|uniref:DUF5919 domain-containing protein n=1 Tax=Georgenia sp. 311 TaxID=2585134 RepID=UPI001112BA81|nr:DUF5919 domain-containing protein [Georgenia sp. 311]TNC16617.1 hypothetical protein FHE66_14670 [Georgenia sp. 311]